MIHYQEFSPAQALSDYVDCHWIVSMEGPESQLSPVQRCLPMGMVELIIHTKGKPSIGVVGGRAVVFPEAYLVGIMKEPVEWQLYGGSELIGMRLKPEGLIQLFQRPIASFFNTYIEVGKWIGQPAHALIGKIVAARTYTEQRFLLEAFFQSHLHQATPAKNHFVEAVAAIRKNNEAFTTETLENNLFVCERQVQRLFKSHLGLTPKEYFRIIRFRTMLDAIKQERAVSWAKLAYDLGYSDQSHLIRDFKQFAGIPPKTFIRGLEKSYYLQRA